MRRIDAIGLRPYLESLGLKYEVVDEIMRNDIIINKPSHIRRALDSRYSLPTCHKWAQVWLKENIQDNKSEKENNNVND